MQAQMDFLFQSVRLANSYMPMHAHTCYELVYYGSGSGTTHIRDAAHGYRSGTYAILAAGTLHDERRLTDTDVICVGFRLSGLDMQLREGLYEEETDRPLQQLLLAMLTEMQEQRPYYPEKLNYLLGMIVIEHQRKVQVSAFKESADHLHYARAYIDENYNQKITVEELAEMVGYSYHHFRHLFKKKFGRSPIAYLLNKRIQRASHLLLHSALPVTAIAEECGFSSDAQFSTLFKREQGEPPRSFRQKRH
ncbi:AraC family transcriptional regulator [Paenibacillus sacheonensis]|uniref:Helix-turn-helix domain-containing protein n=1 Tax=Paenibacillus sacheonensis TaxID=742054 RepID=A0A7X5BZU5_9BACL|nr:AraC family transcriptional regulator [Paenibacillus sacheonensis]MBM7568263.1 AraC family transcriptional activator of pobA [Paenibacillus sacheonensis]NBC68550.1 helix-turn-helix domain-containing protein [Paenibacillus sacheonensis]